MSQPTNMDTDVRKTQLALAQQQARLATLTADKAELELLQAREAAKKGPDAKSVVDELKTVKDLLSSSSSAAPSGTTFSGKGPDGTSFLYEVLTEAVKALKSAIYSAEFEYQGKTHQDVTLIYVGDDLSSLAAQYHGLLLRIQTAYAIYSDLSVEQEETPEAPIETSLFQSLPPVAALAAVLPGIQGIAAGLALAQGVAQVFAIKRSIATSDVTVNKGVFEDLLKADLHSDSKNSAVQMPSLNWDIPASLISTKPLRLTHALRDLMGLTTRSTFDPTGPGVQGAAGLPERRDRGDPQGGAGVRIWTRPDHRRTGDPPDLAGTAAPAVVGRPPSRLSRDGHSRSNAQAPLRNQRASGHRDGFSHHDTGRNGGGCRHLRGASESGLHALKLCFAYCRPPPLASLPSNLCVSTRLT